MSRGLGALQRTILTEVPLRSVVSIDKLRWALAERHGAVIERGGTPLPEGGITKSFEQNFQRAIRRLVEDERLVQRRRRLETLDDLVELYPYKTRKLGSRRLREALVPSLTQFLANKKSRHGGGEIERFVGHDSTAGAEWMKLDTSLLELERRTDARRRELVLELRVKWRALFNKKSRVSVGVSLRALLVRAEREFLSSPDVELVQNLLSLYDRCFDRSLLRSTLLKSRLHHAVDLSARFPPRLKDDAKDFLLEVNPSFVEALPGFYRKNPTPTSKPDISYLLDPRSRVRYPKILDRLIDRDVYRSFIMLERPSAQA